MNRFALLLVTVFASSCGSDDEVGVNQGSPSAGVPLPAAESYDDFERRKETGMDSEQSPFIEIAKIADGEIVYESPESITFVFDRAKVIGAIRGDYLTLKLFVASMDDLHPTRTRVLLSAWNAGVHETNFPSIYAYEYADIWVTTDLDLSFSDIEGRIRKRLPEIIAAREHLQRIITRERQSHPLQHVPSGAIDEDQYPNGA